MSKEIRFPDGTIVRGCGLAARDENQGWRDFGLYLDAQWRPEWDAVVLEWPDFGVPASQADADQAITMAFRMAREGKHVEIGCLGGVGRTGTVLACMAVLAGIRGDQAVEWVKEAYSPYAVEEDEQETWVLGFAERTAGTKP